MFLLLIIGLVILLFFYQRSFETFLGYNVSFVPDDQVNSSYATQNKRLQTLFDTANKANQAFDNTPLTNGTLYNTNVKFRLAPIFKTFLQKYLVDNKIFTSNTTFASDLNNLTFVDSDTSRIFTFDITVSDQTSFISRTINVKMTLANNYLFVNPSPINSNTVSNIDYITNPDSSTVISNLTINSVDLDQSTSSMNLADIDELNPGYYEIYNKFHLMDPFLTSGKDMLITDEMRLDFTKVIAEKQRLKTTDYQTYKA